MRLKTVTLVIFTSPVVIILLSLALAMVIFEVIFKFTGYLLPLIALAIVIGAMIYAILIGASLFEVATVAIVFMVLNLFGIGRKKK